MMCRLGKQEHVSAEEFRAVLHNSTYALNNIIGFMEANGVKDPIIIQSLALLGVLQGSNAELPNYDPLLMKQVHYNAELHKKVLYGEKDH